jgi:hypothetical protein
MENINSNGKRLIDSFAKGFADLTVGIFADLAADYNRRQAEEKQAKKETCVALIEEAIKTGKRIHKQALFDILPYLSHCSSRAEIAVYLGITSDKFNAGVKRWYHIF